MDFITSVDFSILNWIQDNIRCAFLDPVMTVFTYMGEAGLFWIALAVVLVFFKKYRATALIMLSAMAVGFLFGELIVKNIVMRPRPFVTSGFELFISPPGGFSFPSGHSSSSFAAATALLLKDRRFGIPAIIVAAVIAFSRLYNYVHYPSDVLCGIILGIACALLMTFIFKKTGASKKLSGN